MKIDGNAIRPGMVIEHKGALWRAIKTEHTQPGKGGAYLQVELRDIRTGTKLNERFRSSEKVERATLEQREYQYLYPEGDSYTFMDNETYEQVTLSSEFIADDQVPFLQDGMKATPSACSFPTPSSARSSRPTRWSRARRRRRRSNPPFSTTASRSWCRRTSRPAPASS
jgi:translation elongation factor P/translation initiation factor 5A